MTVFINGRIGPGLLTPGNTVETVLAQLEEENGDTIDVVVNSYGGDPFAGTAIMRLLQRQEEKVVVEIAGVAASAASIVAMGGDEVRMTPSSLLMIHNAMGSAFGDHRLMRDTADTLETITEAMSRTYGRADVDDDELKKMLDDETWLTAEEALNKNFIDEITDEDDEDTEEVEARIVSQINARAQQSDIDNFTRVPAAVASMAYRTGRHIAASAGRPTASTTAKGAEMAQQDENQGADSASSDDNQTAVEASGNTAARDSEADAGFADGRKAEMERQRRIRETGRKLGFGAEQLDRVVNEGLPVDRSLEKLADIKAETQYEAEGRTGPIQSTAPGHIAVGEEDHEKFTSAVTDALVARAAHKSPDAQNPYGGLRISGMARQWLQMQGVNTNRMTKSEIARAIFNPYASGSPVGRHTTSDFKEILKDVAHKSLMDAWSEENTTYQEWTRSGALMDFRPHHRVSMNQFPRFKKVPESAEFDYATFGERREAIWLTTYERGFRITRQAIINDDLQSFTQIPQMMGAAGARTVQFLVSMMLIHGDDADKGQVMTHSGNPIFHSDHNNIIDEPLTADTLSEARKKMRQQRDPDGEGLLMIQPRHLLVSDDNVDNAYKLLQSTADPSQDNSAVVNPNQAGRTGIQVIPDENLGYDEIGGDPDEWYLQADRPGVEVAGLEGPPQPVIETDNVTARGTEHTALLDVGVRQIDERASLKSTGGGG